MDVRRSQSFFVFSQAIVFWKDHETSLLPTVHLSILRHINFNLLMECEKVILEYFHLHSMQWEKYILTVFIPVHSIFSLIGIGGGATNTVGPILILIQY